MKSLLSVLLSKAKSQKPKAKSLLLSVLLLSSALLNAATVSEITSPASGESFALGVGGRLVAVQAFSTNATGTVAVKSIYEAPIFTNAVAISSTTATNYTTVSSNRLAETFAPHFYVVTNAVEISTNIYTHAVVTNIITSTALTNIPVVVALTTNVIEVSGFTPQQFARAYPAHTLLSFSTNITTTATTSIWPVVKSVVAKTNTLVSGTCASNVYTGAPPAAVYLAPRERLVFEGTATGGFLRLVFE